MLAVILMFAGPIYYGFNYGFLVDGVDVGRVACCCWALRCKYEIQDQLPSINMVKIGPCHEYKSALE